MKTLLCTLFIPLFGMSQISNLQQRVESPIRAVTLYLDGAEINQQKTIDLNAGITSVVFTNLSSRLIPKSIQVNVGERVRVLSASEKLNFLKGYSESAQVKQLKD